MRREVNPFHWREASLCVPALPALLLCGLVTGQVTAGAIAAGAAFSVGFGASRDLRGRRWGAMIAATLGMALAASVGSLAGNALPVFLLLAGLAAAGCAALALYDEDLWWIFLQVVIALLVASNYPGRPDQALERALTVLIGGGVQIVCVAILARLVPSASARLPRNPAIIPPERRLLITHMVRAGACIPIAVLAAHALGIANSYWAPMTALLILKPGLQETQARGIARLGGTIAGCGVATLFAVAVDYSPSLLLIGMAISAGLSFAWQKAHYVMLSAAITATIVILLSIGHGGVIANVEHRLIATLVGGLIALIIARISPFRRRHAHSHADRVG